MPTPIERPTRGEDTEDRARELLRLEGYEIVARNWRCRTGEIDIIARDGPVLAFVEVKSRCSVSFGGPEAAVHRAKQRRIIAAAQRFLSTVECELAIRFDVVTFLGSCSRLIRDAFRMEDGCSPN